MKDFKPNRSFSVWDYKNFVLCPSEVDKPEDSQNTQDSQDFTSTNSRDEETHGNFGCADSKLTTAGHLARLPSNGRDETMHQVRIFPSRYV